MKRQEVKGKGSDLADKKLQHNRGKKKMITRAIVKSMLEIAERKGDERFKKSLWNAYYCLDKIITGNGRMFTNYYCKSRICTVCAGNRKAALINRYFPEIIKWKDPYFVTLTVKSVPAKLLDKWINEGMIRGFNRIIAKFRKRKQRGKSAMLMGVRTLECNFNPKKGIYNPHFHLIVASREMAEILISEWLNLWHSDKKLYTSPKAQDMRPIKDLQLDLIEVIKYGTKIFTQPNPDKTKRVKGSERIYAKALYNILSAMKGRHLFEHFGFTPPLSEHKNEPIILSASLDWKYNQGRLDWTNKETDEVLTNFTASQKLVEMCNDIDVELE